MDRNVDLTRKKKSVSSTREKNDLFIFTDIEFSTIHFSSFLPPHSLSRLHFSVRSLNTNILCLSFADSRLNILISIRRPNRKENSSPFLRFLPPLFFIFFVRNFRRHFLVFFFLIKCKNRYFIASVILFFLNFSLNPSPFFGFYSHARLFV